MDEEDAFQAAIDENQTDQANRLIFADWLEERGDERHDGYRTMARLNLYPDMCYQFRFVYADEEWSPPHSDRSVLPKQWFRAIGDEKRVQLVSRRAAEDEAARAFARLTDEDRAAIKAQTT